MNAVGQEPEESVILRRPGWMPLSKGGCPVTMLFLSILCFLVTALGIVSVVLGLGIRHPIRSAVALTLGAIVILAGATLFYEVLSHRSQEAQTDLLIKRVSDYVKLRSERLKPHLHAVKKPGGGQAGHIKGGTSGGQ